MILFGPGGTGKTTFLNVIYEALEGACGTVPEGTFSTKSNKLGSNVVAQLIGNRMVICGDVDGMESVNTLALKTSVGNDYIEHNGYKTKITCSLAIATNGLPDPISDAEYTSDPIVRRTVCVYMNTTASLLPRLKRNQDQYALLDFLCSCIHVIMSNEYVPISPANVLLTMCGVRWPDLMTEIEECEEPTLHDMVEVISLIHAYTLIPTNHIAHKAALVSPTSVVNIHGMMFLRGLRPRDHCCHGL